MTRFAVPPALALMLLGCSSGPEAQPTATPAARVASAPAATPAAATASDRDSRTPPRPAEPRTFRDWAVACDNVARCTMASLAPEAGDFPGVWMTIERLPGPGGTYEITLSEQGDVPDSATHVAVEIDGRRFPITGDTLAGTRAQAIVDAVAKGRTLAVEDARGGTFATLSLAGAAAALRYIDAEQGRAGTVTATVARGPRPATAVPPARALPVIVALAPSGTAAKPDTAQLAQMKRIGKCEDRPGLGAIWDPEVAALGGGATLVILPCSAGAYNVIGALFVIRDGQVRAVEVDSPSGFEETGADSATPVHSVVNGAFDGGVLISQAKGRGIGDCGVAQDYVWDGVRMRLVEQHEMRECRGNPAFLTTWRAKVIRR